MKRAKLNHKIIIALCSGLFFAPCISSADYLGIYGTAGLLDALNNPAVRFAQSEYSIISSDIDVTQVEPIDFIAVMRNSGLNYQGALGLTYGFGMSGFGIGLEANWFRLNIQDRRTSSAIFTNEDIDHECSDHWSTLGVVSYNSLNTLNAKNNGSEIGFEMSFGLGVAKPFSGKGAVSVSGEYEYNYSQDTAHISARASDLSDARRDLYNKLADDILIREREIIRTNFDDIKRDGLDYLVDITDQAHNYILAKAKNALLAPPKPDGLDQVTDYNRLRDDAVSDAAHQLAHVSEEHGKGLTGWTWDDVARRSSSSNNNYQRIKEAFATDIINDVKAKDSDLDLSITRLQEERNTALAVKIDTALNGFIRALSIEPISDASKYPSSSEALLYTVSQLLRDLEYKVEPGTMTKDEFARLIIDNIKIHDSTATTRLLGEKTEKNIEIEGKIKDELNTLLGDLLSKSRDEILSRHQGHSDAYSNILNTLIQGKIDQQKHYDDKRKQYYDTIVKHHDDNIKRVGEADLRDIKSSVRNSNDIQLKEALDKVLIRASKLGDYERRALASESDIKDYVAAEQEKNLESYVEKLAMAAYHAENAKEKVHKDAVYNAAIRFDSNRAPTLTGKIRGGLLFAATENVQIGVGVSFTYLGEPKGDLKVNKSTISVTDIMRPKGTSFRFNDDRLTVNTDPSVIAAVDFKIGVNFNSGKLL